MVFDNYSCAWKESVKNYSLVSVLISIKPLYFEPPHVLARSIKLTFCKFLGKIRKYEKYGLNNNCISSLWCIFMKVIYTYTRFAFLAPIILRSLHCYLLTFTLWLQQIVVKLHYYSNFNGYSKVQFTKTNIKPFAIWFDICIGLKS